MPFQRSVKFNFLVKKDNFGKKVFSLCCISNEKALFGKKCTKFSFFRKCTFLGSFFGHFGGNLCKVGKGSFFFAKVPTKLVIFKGQKMTLFSSFLAKMVNLVGYLRKAEDLFIFGDFCASFREDPIILVFFSF